MSGRTTERILNAAAKGLLFLFLYVMLGLCWIGAECVFEGIVHDSRVDGVVLAWLCWLIVGDITRITSAAAGAGSCATGCGGAGRKRYEMRAIPR